MRYGIILTIFILLVGCVSDEEMLRVFQFTESDAEVYELTEKEMVKKVMMIIDEVNWNKEVALPKRNQDYLLKFEKATNNELFGNYDIWFENDIVVVFDKLSGKIGTLSAKYEKELRTILQKEE